MKSKILLALLILFIFSLPSFSKAKEYKETTTPFVCLYGTNGRLQAVDWTESEEFQKMIMDPQNARWKDGLYVVGLWNYWEHYKAGGKNLPLYATPQDSENYAKRIIARIKQIATFMQSKPSVYNGKKKGMECYFHYLSKINNSLCEVTRSCNGGNFKLGKNGNVVFVSNDNKQPEDGTTPEQATAATVRAFESGISGNGNGHGSGGGQSVSLGTIVMFR